MVIEKTKLESLIYSYENELDFKKELYSYTKKEEVTVQIKLLKEFITNLKSLQTKMKTILFKKTFLTISFDNQNKWLITEWEGNQTMNTVSEGGIEILKHFEETKSSKILNVGGLHTSTVEWMVTIWFPTMEESGLKHYAWVLPPNIFAELSAIKATPNTGIIKSFNDYDKAEKWLISQS